VESLFIFQCGLCGALQQAYLPIVGSGNNGAILHYIANNQEITDGEMLLIDAGTEYWGYPYHLRREYFNTLIIFDGANIWL
jgi:Xaa-Pro aminopeptidase